MITIRKARERGRTRFDWLDSWHTFSFGDYRDPRQMGFRDLRVINDDIVAPGQGFGTHPHRDMEILTWVIEGSLKHEDSMGNGSVIRPGEAQRMTAGTGVLHSEFNPSSQLPTRLLQIWILPERKGLPPGYEQKAFPEPDRRGRLKLIASPDGEDGSVTLHQDARVHATLLGPGQTVTHPIQPDRHAWIQVARGDVTVAGESLSEGDGAAASGGQRLEIRGERDAEILLFDLA